MYIIEQKSMIRIYRMVQFVGLRAMRRAKPLLNQSLLRHIYQTIVPPHFNYCNTVWDCIDQTRSDKLQ